MPLKNKSTRTAIDAEYIDLIDRARKGDWESAIKLLRDFRDALRSPVRDSMGHTTYPIRRVVTKYFERCITRLLNEDDPVAAFNLTRACHRPRSADTEIRQLERAQFFLDQIEKGLSDTKALEISATNFYTSTDSIKKAVTKWTVKIDKAGRKLVFSPQGKKVKT